MNPNAGEFSKFALLSYVERIAGIAAKPHAHEQAVSKTKDKVNAKHTTTTHQKHWVVAVALGSSTCYLYEGALIDFNKSILES